MNVQQVHSDHSAQKIDVGASSHPPAAPARVADEAQQNTSTAHPVAPTANTTLFQNAHTPTGSRVDTHK
jgi:hypothetical protein